MAPRSLVASDKRAVVMRHFVIVVSSEDKLLVDWGTEKVDESLDTREWPRVYLERNAIQELSFKDMIDHVGLDIN